MRQRVGRARSRARARGIGALASAALFGLMGTSGYDMATAQSREPAAAKARLPAQAPFPPVRGGSKPKAASAEPSAGTAPAPPACLAALAGRAIVAQRPPIVGPDGCGAPEAVRLEAVITRSGRHVALEPAADLRCGMAETVVEWVRYDVAAAMPVGAAPLASIITAASYHCRTRNHIAGAMISEHGLANALDIRTLRLADGAILDLTDRSVDKSLRERLRATACERFSTVLGPGSDGFHEDHIHLDLRERRSGYRLCRWDVLEPATAAIASGPPLPPERPSASSMTASISTSPQTKPLPSVLRGREAVAHLPKVEQSPPVNEKKATSAPMPLPRPAGATPVRAGSKKPASRRSGSARRTRPGAPTDLRKMLRF